MGWAGFVSQDTEIAFLYNSMTFEDFTLYIALQAHCQFCWLGLGTLYGELCRGESNIRDQCDRPEAGDLNRIS